MKNFLDGIRVLDFTQYISGPYCTKLFATLGAEVLKIEKPRTGDPLRHQPPFANNINSPETGAWFLYLNTSKKSICIDLKTTEGRDTILKLIPNIDLIIENFSPGTMNKLGLDYKTMSAINPAIVMTSISNYGQNGPYSDWKATELNLYASGGLMKITGEPDNYPLKEGAPLAQLGCGQNAFVASLGATMLAEDTGVGQYIDISIAEYGTNVMENAFMQYSYSGVEYTRVGNRGYGRAAWGIYPCADGFVGIISGPDHRWSEFASIMEREELSDPKYGTRSGRLEYADEIDALMLPWLIENKKEDIFKAGQEHGLGFAYVSTISDILEMEQLVDRSYFIEIEHPIAGNLLYPGMPIKTDLDKWIYSRSPLLGEDTKSTLSKYTPMTEQSIEEGITKGYLQ